MCTTTQHVVNILTLENQHFRVRFGGGGHKKEYSLYAFINVDNCERPLRGFAKLEQRAPSPLLDEAILTDLTHDLVFTFPFYAPRIH